MPRVIEAEDKLRQWSILASDHLNHHVDFVPVELAQCIQLFEVKQTFPISCC